MAVENEGAAGSTDDDFDKAFSEAITADATPPVEDTGKEDDKVEGEQKPEGEAEKPPVVAGEQQADPLQADEQKPDPAQPPVEQKPDAAKPDPMAQLTDAVKALGDRMPPAKAEAAPPADDKPGKFEPPALELTAEQKKSLEEFDKDWSDVSAAVKVREQVALHAMETKFAATLNAVLQNLYTELAPVLQTHVTSAVDSHFSAIKKAHPDYDQVVDLMPEWIGKQPKYLKDTYQRVYESGNAEEMTDLTSRFKEATGRATPQQPSGNQPSNPKAPLDKTKADSLAPVGGQRTTPQPRGVDLNDFDGAFDEAVAAGKR